MKKKHYILFIFLISSTLGISQNIKIIDSLTALVSKQKEVDLARTLNELAWEYAKKNDSIAIKYAEQARKISDSLGYSLELATSYIRLGTIYLDANKFEQAEINLTKALELEEKEANLSGIARAKAQLGKLYKKLRDYEKAIEFYKESLSIRQKQNDHKRKTLLYNNIARLYKAKNNPTKALHYYYKSIRLRDSIQDKKGLIVSYKNIGSFYNDLKKHIRAINVLKKGRKISIELQDSIQLSSILLNIGTSYNYLQELDSAATYFSQSLLIKEKLGIKKTATIYNNIGTIEEKKNNFAEAIILYKKSISIAKQNKNEIQLMDTYHNIGKAYKKKEQYNKTLEYYLEALQLVENYNRNDKKSNILSSIGKVYELLEDYQNANLYNERHIILRNELEKQKRKDEEAILLLNEERDKNKILEAEKEKSQAENNTKTTQLIALVIGCILITILFFILFKYYRQKKQKEIAIQNERIKQGEIEELLKNQELKSIHAMIDGQEKERKRIAQDLHDRLGSMLSVVKIHYKSVEDNLNKMKEDSKIQYGKANELLDEACVAVREISHNLVSGVLTKFGLIPALRELKQNLESTGTLEIELIDYGFDDRISNELEINIYRIIQELISNTLKHAQAKEISIQLLKKDNTVNITIFDDGKGFDTNLIKNFSGIGIKGILSRVENLQGEIVFDSSIGNGTTITMGVRQISVFQEIVILL